MARIRESAPWVSGARKTSGPYSGGPAKGLFHATIAPSHALPDYNNQGSAPHQTLLWNRATKVLTARQHYYFDNFAKALANAPGGVETNRDTVLQWELAGYISSYKMPAGEFDILNAPSTYWEQVADIVGPVVVSWGIKNTTPALWTPAGKLSLSQWDAFSGVLAHIHAPENNHTDLPLKPEIVQFLMGKIFTDKPAVITNPPVVHVPTTKKVSTPNSPVFPYSPRHYFGTTRPDPLCHSGRYSSKDRGYIRLFQKQLRVRGWNIDVDGIFGPQTEDVVTAFQSRKRLGVDGKVGVRTWPAIWRAA